MNDLTYHALSGKQIEPFTSRIGEVRIAVFREFPYLYDGDLRYEKEYLRIYSESENSFIFTVSDGESIIGVTTALPLSEETPEVQKPFIAAGIDVGSVCYFGESILLPSYRGRGLGHLFFDEREKFARAKGFSVTAFCAVNRPENHPLRPENYRPNDEFWKKRGYEKHPGMTCEMSWKDVGEQHETTKQLTFWIRKWK